MLVLLLLVPAGSFAEREHEALIGAWPMLAALALRLQRGRPDWRLAVLAGLCGAVTIVIKPMFALAFVGPGLLLLRGRGWRAVLQASELWTGAIATGLYGLAVLLFFPDFTTRILPWVVASYVPVRHSWGALLSSPNTVIWLALAVLAGLLHRMLRLDAWGRLLALAAAGFYAAFLIQGKDWPYQILPATILLAAAVAHGLLDRASVRQPLPLRGVMAATLAVLCAMAGYTFDNRLDLDADMPGLRQAIARLAPHPSLMSVTSEIAVGHPLVRDVGGRWVGTFGFQWLTSGLDAQESQGLGTVGRERLADLSAEERRIVAADLGDRKPDAVIVQGPRWLDYLTGDPRLKSAFDAYRREGDYGLVSLWVRKNP